MANNFPNYQFTNATQMPQNQQQQIQQPQQSFFSPMTLFPQPVGGVYSLNTSSDVSNLPTGNGLSIGLCMNESTIFIKSLQNGEPMFLAYKLSPLSAPAADQKDEKLNNYLKQQDEKISTLELEIKKLKEKMGGELKWQI